MTKEKRIKLKKEKRNLRNKNNTKSSNSRKNVLWMNDGTKYVGNIKNGEPHGFGTFYCLDGSMIEGVFKDGKLCNVKINDEKIYSEIIYTYPDGNKYKGEVNIKGEKHGEGEINFPNGEKYVGNFVNNNYHGFGTYTFVDGTFLFGEWLDNELVNDCGIEVKNIES